MLFRSDEFTPEFQMTTSMGYVDLKNMEEDYRKQEASMSEGDYTNVYNPDTMVLYAFGWNHTTPEKHPGIYKALKVNPQYSTCR